jgi:hypothetical protein
MKRITTRMLLVGSLALTGVGLVRTATAQEETETTRRSAGKMTKERERRLVGTIDSINKDTREVALIGEQGQKETFTVPPSFKGFDKLKVGDRVNVTYTESVALGLGKPGEKANVQTRGGTSVTPSAEGRSGVGMHQVQVTAEIASVDPEKNEITFKGPEGNMRSVTVDNPELRDKLGDLKPGDTVQLTYTEAIAGSITPAKKK